MALIPSTKIALSFPLWTCDFDSTNSNLLVVGGGGGGGRNGVGNKLTLLEISNDFDLSNAGELELNKNEDNVSTVAVGPRRDKNMVVFGGVNGSAEDMKKGKNQHFRCFSINLPGRSTKSRGVGVNAKISEVARESLFIHREGDTETYQRLLRLSQPFDGQPQLGAAATGVAREAQIALFDVPASGSARWKSRARLDVPKEPMDLDVIQTGPWTYQMVYCDKYDIFTVEISKEGVSEPRCVYTMENHESRGRPTLKSIRYLSPAFLFAVANNADRKGATLLGLRLPTKENEKARIAVVKSLPKNVTVATGLALRNLMPLLSPTDKQGDTQYVIAVPSSDLSIALYTLDYKSSGTIDLLTNLRRCETLKSVHTQMITALSFSTFTPSAKPQGDLSIKLASVSMANEAIVHSIPLKKFVDKSTTNRGPPRPARYVIALKSEKESGLSLMIIFALIVVFLAILGQVIVEATGMGEPVLGTNKYLPVSWTVPLRQGPVLGSKFMGDLLNDIKPNQQAVVRSNEAGQVGLRVHSEEAPGAKEWHELEPGEQHLWKERLKETGNWAEAMGESAFKSILFGEIGGAVGGMVGEAL